MSKNLADKMVKIVIDSLIERLIKKYCRHENIWHKSATQRSLIPAPKPGKKNLPGKEKVYVYL